MSYKEWQADRQRYLDSRTSFQVLQDLRYQQYNKNDAYYFGLTDRINARQEDKIPLAGAGAVDFLTLASDVTKPFVRFGAPFAVIHGLFETTERLVRYKTGIVD